MIKKELAKNYDPCTEEKEIYERWLLDKSFHADICDTKKPFTIVMPPPNITGRLHMGHALDNTIQDILIRWKRMLGYNVLWLPGCDHASISTELKIVEKLREDNLTKEQIGRTEFLKRSLEWKDLYGSAILSQLKSLGASCDWDRERFTLDDDLQVSVKEAFLRLYNKGLIYRKEKIVNWCPACKTTISDAEVAYEDRESKFWYINYQLKDGQDYIQVATTRPETILGDLAIAVNPMDDRYSKYIGKKVIVPVVNREIPIISDHYVKMDFGTGAVKITPAHDPNDFEVGLRHDLGNLNIFNDDATVNAVHTEYEGLDRYQARIKILKDLKDLNLLVKEQSIKNSVGLHERCSIVVEPLLKLQWFVDMKELAQPAIETVEKGDLKFVPHRFSKVYLNWLYNINDWCISRQLWWGHRIPAYYCSACGEVNIAIKAPVNCKYCGCSELLQDPDTLDTWFSSALWPFATMGWPNETQQLKYFYPTDVLVTSYDIIFFWVARMVFSAIEHTNKLPFKTVVIHGLIRDAEGKKMSKSLGNGVDPINLIDKYGADTLRFMLINGNALGNDIRFNTHKIDAGRNFINKLWNITKFLTANTVDLSHSNPTIVELTTPDKWILMGMNSLIQEVNKNMQDFEMSLALSAIYSFIWDEYCDWYIEMTKPRIYEQDNNSTRTVALCTLKLVLNACLKMLHPYMPFITKKIYGIMNDDEDIMFSDWPIFNDNYKFEKEKKDIELIKLAIKGIRNVRATMSVPINKSINLYLSTSDDNIKNVFGDNIAHIKRLAKVSEVGFVSEDSLAYMRDSRNTVSIVLEGFIIYIPFNDLLDMEDEIVRLTEEQKKLQSEIDRAKLKLGNKEFINKAPKNIVDEERIKLQKYLDMYNKVVDRLSNLGV